MGQVIGECLAVRALANTSGARRQCVHVRGRDRGHGHGACPRRGRCGSNLALEVARELVLYLRRPGGQSQFSGALNLKASDWQPFRDLGAWVLEHLRHNLSVEVLASRVGMSPRNFARVFRFEMNTTPAKFDGTPAAGNCTAPFAGEQRQPRLCCDDLRRQLRCDAQHFQARPASGAWRI